MSATKIYTLQQLAERLEQVRSEGKRVVLCHGTFDLMHAGHIRHLQAAAREGDLLCVTITADAHVNKGPGRPVFNEQLRAESLAALDCVNLVGVNDDPTAINVLELLKPDFYVKGSEYQKVDDDVTGNIALEKAAVENHGGRLIFTDDITFSSSKLLNEHFGIFSDEIRDYLRDFGSRYRDVDLFTMLDKLAGLKVLVVGDAIVDEYHYTSSLGQTGKGNILAVKYESGEQFAGGSVAVANHLAGFAEQVDLLAVLGKTDSHEAFLRSKLKANVTPHFYFRDDGPTVVKRRFVDADMAKLFEVYFFTEKDLPETVSDALCQWLDQQLDQYDAVIVPDFGNGMIGPCMRRVLSEKARFLAVNTQINSGNRGYHVITQYPRADYVSLNEPELRLAAYDRHSSIEAVACAVADKLTVKHAAVTRGTRGVMLCDPVDRQYYPVPALSTKVIDRIGAGDSFLALSSLCLAGGLSAEVAAFVGSAAAALDVQIVCNRDSIERGRLYKYITTLLKWD